MQEVVIVGGGPGGAATALFLAQRGIRSTLVEKDCFPRYHIGESLTGECGKCLRTLGLEQQMAGQPVKRGVKVFGPEGRNSFYVPVMARTEERLMDATTWQVRRSDFDHMLFRRLPYGLHAFDREGGSPRSILAASPHPLG